MAVALLAIMTMAAIATVSTPGPALADEPGLPCYLAATGTITAPSPVFVGDVITVQWNVSSFCDTGLLAYMSGPGFDGGESVGLSGSRQIFIAPGEGGGSGNITWELLVRDDEMDNPGGRQVASMTITCVRACIEP
jgi:hypothetical protein